MESAKKPSGERRYDHERDVHMLRAELFSHYRGSTHYQELLDDIRESHPEHKSFFRYSWEVLDEAASVGDDERAAYHATLTSTTKEKLGLKTPEGEAAPWAVEYVHIDVSEPLLVSGSPPPSHDFDAQTVTLTIDLEMLEGRLMIAPAEYADRHLFARNEVDVPQAAITTEPLGSGDGATSNDSRRFTKRLTADAHRISQYGAEDHAINPYAFTEWDQLQEKAIQAVKAAIATMRQKHSARIRESEAQKEGEKESGWRVRYGAAMTRRADGVETLFRNLFYGESILDTEDDPGRRDYIQKNIAKVLGITIRRTDRISRS